MFIVVFVVSFVCCQTWPRQATLCSADGGSRGPRDADRPLVSREPSIFGLFFRPQNASQITPKRFFCFFLVSWNILKKKWFKISFFYILLFFNKVLLATRFGSQLFDLFVHFLASRCSETTPCCSWAITCGFYRGSKCRWTEHPGELSGVQWIQGVWWRCYEQILGR